MLPLNGDKNSARKCAVRISSSRRQLVSLAALITIFPFAGTALAQLETPPNDTVLHIFNGGSDGYIPAGGVVFDHTDRHVQNLEISASL